MMMTLLIEAKVNNCKYKTVNLRNEYDRILEFIPCINLSNFDLLVEERNKLS